MSVIEVVSTVFDLITIVICYVCATKRL